MGCDIIAKHQMEGLKVSIHAPVWGATTAKTITKSVALFQSTHPCGVRQNFCRWLKGGAVSIHAPVWGATVKREQIIHKLSFNPRTRVGCDNFRGRSNNRHWFQSTHPCGVRLGEHVHLYRPQKFQSTHPCGVRRQQLYRLILS